MNYALILAVGSLGVTILCYLMGFPFFFLFLLFPLIPFWKSEPEKRRCPVCGFEGTDTIRFCPYDGSELQ